METKRLILFFMILLITSVSTSQTKQDTTRQIILNPIEIVASRPIIEWRKQPTIIDTLAKQLPIQRAVDFAFVFKYEICGDYDSLNTYNHTFSKKYGDLDTTITMRLSDNQMDSIYRKIRTMHFLNYPKDYCPVDIILISPSFSFYLKVQANNYDNEISIGASIESEDQNTKSLKDLFELIRSMIYKNEAFRNISKSAVIRVYE
jgi:predicted DNA binding CopG/RHH family protein